MTNAMPMNHDALLDEDLVRALEELVEIVEIICAPIIPPMTAAGDGPHDSGGARGATGIDRRRSR